MSASDTLEILPDDFDPRTQLLNYTSAFGPTLITFNDLQDYFVSNIQFSIILGCRIGCAGLMAVMLTLISRNRKTPIFILNQLSLFFLIIHSALYINYLFGAYNSVAETFTGFDLSTPGAKRVTIATNITQVLLIICIEGSLVFQVKIIFKSPEVQKVGIVLTLISFLLGLATVGCYLAACIKSSSSLDSKLTWVYINLPIIMFAVSTVFICFILIAKLGLAIRSRRYLGLKQFGTLQILIIVTTQTMIIPMILVILSFSSITTIYSRLTPIAIMFVTLQLPLSSMWATSANNSPEPSSSGSSFIYKSTSRDTHPSLISSKDGILQGGDPQSPTSSTDDESHHYKDENYLFSLYPTKKEETVVRTKSGLDMYELSEDDKSLWEELQRLTMSYNENDNEEFVSTVVHKINSRTGR